MTLNSSEWDEDIPADPEEEYQAFINVLKRTEGFRLLFVRCNPAEGKQLIVKVKEDIPQKTIEVLSLSAPIDNLYQIVEHLPNQEQINILFIQGLEYSFYEYEKLKFGDTNERDFYSWKGVPRILNHLNQHRERFRDKLNICFVFLLRSFSIKYFIHRAPDFFDWRSSVFEFPTTPEILEQESSRILLEGGYEKYLTFTPEEQLQKVIEIQELLEENYQTPDNKAGLLVELGNLLYSSKEYEAAIASYDHALKIKPDDHQAWNLRGSGLFILGRLEAAIDSFDHALKIKPDDHQAWNFRGSGLFILGRLEAAIDNFDYALKIKPDDHEALNLRGFALFHLGRLEAAIDSYDQALKIKPDKHEAWYNRGIALKNLGRLEAAIDSYDQALKIKPDNHEAWNNRGNALFHLGRLEAAIDSYDQALKIKPDKHEAWNNRGNALFILGRLEAAIENYDQALKIKPDNYEAWYNQGIVLSNLGRYEEAVASYDQALEFKPDKHEVWYNKACCYALQGNVELAIENLQKAIQLSPDKYIEMAKTDSDFDGIREDDRFQALIREKDQLNSLS